MNAAGTEASLLRRQTNVKRETKLFRDYALQLLKTRSPHLHGLCCDIDVETGPRQMPSRYLRKRLEALVALYPRPTATCSRASEPLAA
jgi:hypothetical protein